MGCPGRHPERTRRSVYSGCERCDGWNELGKCDRYVQNPSSRCSPGSSFPGQFGSSPQRRRHSRNIPEAGKSFICCRHQGDLGPHPERSHDGYVPATTAGSATAAAACWRPDWCYRWRRHWWSRRHHYHCCCDEDEGQERGCTCINDRQRWLDHGLHMTVIIDHRHLGCAYDKSVRVLVNSFSLVTKLGDVERVSNSKRIINEM